MDRAGVNDSRYTYHITALRVAYLDSYSEYPHIPLRSKFALYYDTRCAPSAVGCVTFTVPSTDAWRAASAIS